MAMKVHHIIGIDPGLTGTGIAHWYESNVYEPRAVEIITPPARCSEDWNLKLRYISERMYSQVFELTNTRDVVVYIEWPHYMQTEKGIAATNKGDIYKLAALIGAIHYACWDAGANVTLVPVADWKGQLPKNIVEDRIRRILSPEVCLELKFKSHIWDAVGIGLYGQGVKLV
jgi:Holliday junction resolvasome RuvABC endonuclease subunit